MEWDMPMQNPSHPGGGALASHRLCFRERKGAGRRRGPKWNVGQPAAGGGGEMFR